MGRKSKSVVLIGYMGAGKTTIGKKLAQKLGIAFYDTDELIEQEQGVTVAKIFEQHGEPYFRDLETEIVKKLSESEKPMVLSVGGGLPVRRENHEYLKKIGTVVYLKVSVEELVRRLSGDSKRPLLKGTEELSEKITRMLKVRGPLYLEACDYYIETDGKGIFELVTELINHKGEKA